MTNSIASLGFKIDTSQVKQAEVDLDSLNQAGKESEGAANKTGIAWSHAAKKISDSSKGAEQSAAGLLREISGLSKSLASGAKSTQELAKQRETLSRLTKTGAFSESEYLKITAQLDKQQQALVKSTGNEQAALNKLLGAIDPARAALAKLDSQVQRLGKSFDAGLIDQKGYNDGLQKLDAQYAGLEKTSGAAARLGLNTRQARQDVLQLGNALAHGNWTVAANNVAQIGANADLGAAKMLRFAAPIALVAAALGTLAVAYYKGSRESAAYNKSLVLTGNYAGTTTAQLSDMARQVGNNVGTTGQASAALAELAGSGDLAAESFLAITEAAVSMERATGRAVKETISEFVKIAGDPVSAAKELNQQYNFLEASIYAQIVAMTEQGDKIGAVELLTNTYADTVKTRAGEITSDLGLIETAWEGIKDAASGAMDAILNIGRESSSTELLDKTRQQLERLQRNPGRQVSIPGQRGVAGGEEGIQLLQDRLVFLNDEIEAKADIAKYDAAQVLAQKDGIDAMARVDALTKSALTNEQKRTKEVEEYRKQLEKIRAVSPADIRLDPAAVAKNIANINDKFKDPKGPRSAKTPAVRDDAATRLLITLREQQAVLASQLLIDEKLTATQKKRAEFESQVADLKTKDILTADQKSLLANEASIKAQLDKNVALAEEVRLHTDSIKMQERSAQLQASIKSSATGRAEQQERQLSAFGQGSQAQQQAQAAAGIFREFRRYQDQLNKNTPKDLLGSEQYLDAREKIGQGLRDALNQHEEYYKRLEELQGSWQVGASQAFADFAEQSQDIAGQTSALIGGVLQELTQGIGDNFAEALLHGEDLRESMRGLADSILTNVISAMVQMGAQYAINSALEIAGITAVTTAKATSATTLAAVETAAIATTTGAAVASATAVAAAQIPAAAATTTAWAPAATVASIGSFGAAAAIGLAAVVAAIALSKGFRKGGFTGNGGVNDVAGVVHGKEFVFDADAVSRIGVGNLEAMRAGRDVAVSGASAGAAGSSAGRAPITVISNNTYPGITDSREAKRSTAQSSRQIANAVRGTQRYA